MNITKKDLTTLISKIRKDIGHKEVEIEIVDIFFDEESANILIITPDRPEKSVIIGKGGWVVGRLREELGVNSIHVEAYSDYMVPVYRMKLALKKLEEIVPKYSPPLNEPLMNLSNLLKQFIKKPYDLESLLKNYKTPSQSVALSSTYNQVDFKAKDLHGEEKQNDDEQVKLQTVVALSGGVDSSASLIIAKKLGFNPIAVTVNPGDIILPRYFRESVENLTCKLGVEHHYLNVEMNDIIEGALEGTFHPCGRCSKTIERAVLDFTRTKNIPFLIYGDLLSTGTQSLHLEENILRINLLALFALKKGDVKKIAGKMKVKKKGGYGCPLVGEVHKKHPHMRRFSIQRVLRETRAGVLEPGEALNQIKGII
ncbi:MAG: 7-cyano-7-deazaguanine synthase [Methanobacteriaceae archaeon]|nr:7-cyano-7-deazaguanine synthase [Methanobacteriaceae archaeon]